MHNAYDTAVPATFECLHCGELVTGDRPPRVCSGCGRSGTFQHHGMSLE